MRSDPGTWDTVQCALENVHSAGFEQTAPLLSCPQGVKVFSDIQDSQ